MISILFLYFSSYSLTQARELALTFDDAPYGSQELTRSLIRSLKESNIPEVMVLANPCKGESEKATISQLKLYRDAGHLIGNHTCSHNRMKAVGVERYLADTLKADTLLQPLYQGQKFFRFPFLDEGESVAMRDQIRKFLATHHYRNARVTIDNDDYIFTFKLKEALSQGRKIDYSKLQSLFVQHVTDAADYYDKLAVETLGRSPSHVLLLHEMDATVRFIPALVTALRSRGWKIIPASQAYLDPLYNEMPTNTYANNGFIAQVHLEKTGVKKRFSTFENNTREIDRVLRE